MKEELILGGKYMQPEQLDQLILSGDCEMIYNQTSELFQNQIALSELQDVICSFSEGTQQCFLQAITPIGDSKEYTWIDDTGTKGIIALFDSENIITALQLLPLQPFPETDQQWTKNEFILPMRDEWFTFWGGNNELINYHYPYASQRYAFDFVIMEENRTYAGHPNDNEHYFAFGKEVVAPAAGTIVKIENNIIDNKPGEMNEENPSGNYIVIDHGHNEYSIIVHFKQHSLTVTEGDYVKQGEVVGLCGNSGHSSEAHIHFQVSDSPILDDGRSIRIRFKDGREPRRGDFVQQSPS